jgi:citrate lyase subunit beta/citryl-CoA lyase
MAHLTTPATVPKYVEAAVTRSRANLVMLDLEDSIPRDDEALLLRGRELIVDALLRLDWGPRLRFFRPRGTLLDPEHRDIEDIVGRAGHKLDGLVFPKVDGPDEVRAVDAKLRDVERRAGLEPGSVKLEVLVESALAEERAFAIAAASPRLVGLIFGSFDYWSSLAVVRSPYRYDHPLVDGARMRIVKAAASVGVPAIAEMTTNYPTKDKSPAEQAAALDECRRDAEHAKLLGFAGKWTGIPAQVDVALEVFALADERIEAALAAVRAFREAERQGRGAAMIEGRMHDRATDRVHRVVLKTALAMGRLDPALAGTLGIGDGA